MGFLLLIPIVVTCAVCFAAAEGFFGLSLDTKVRPGEVLSIFTTCFLALMIQHLFARRSRQAEAEKDLILGHVRDVATAVKAVRIPLKQAVNISAISREMAMELVSVFEDCSQELGTLEVVMRASRCAELAECCVGIGNHLTRYKNSMTGGNFPQKTFTPADLEKASGFQRTIAKELQLLCLDISKQ